MTTHIATKKSVLPDGGHCTRTRMLSALEKVYMGSNYSSTFDALFRRVVT